MTLGTVAGADLCMLYERAQRARQEIAAAITGGSAECWQVERLRGLIDQGDGSWLVFDRQRGAVTQGGARRLWDEVERLFRRLVHAGCAQPGSVRPDRPPGWPARALAGRS
jgi:hypothetical protein